MCLIIFTIICKFSRKFNYTFDVEQACKRSIWLQQNVFIAVSLKTKIEPCKYFEIELLQCSLIESDFLMFETYYIVLSNTLQLYSVPFSTHFPFQIDNRRLIEFVCLTIDNLNDTNVSSYQTAQPNLKIWFIKKKGFHNAFPIPP